MKRTRPFLLLLLGLICVLCGLTAWMVYREHRQERLNRDMIAAVKRNDTKAVIALLDRGADANCRDEPYKPLPWWQMLRDRLRSVKPKPSTAPTPLLLAVGGPNANLPLVKVLLDHHADVNFRVANTYATPLYFALVFDDPATVGLLLKHGANVNYGSAWETPLAIAIRHYDVEAVRLLLSYHVDITQKANGDNLLAVAKWMVKRHSAEARQIIHLLQQAGAKE